MEGYSPSIVTSPCHREKYIHGRYHSLSRKPIPQWEDARRISSHYQQSSGEGLDIELDVEFVLGVKPQRLKPALDWLKLNYPLLNYNPEQLHNTILRK